MKNKFKVGNIVINNDLECDYYVTCKENRFEGEVIAINNDNDDDIKVKILKSSMPEEIGETYWVDSKYFKLKYTQPIDEIDKYIINNNACIIFWKDGEKTVVKRMEGQKHNKELAFLTAYFQKHCGLSKTKANKFLCELQE